jgi:hypothetical protein
MMVGGARLVALVLVALPGIAAAQVRKPRPVQQPIVRDTSRQQPSRVPGAPGRAVREVPGDSARRDSTAQFSPPDAIMEALLKKTGYTVTRYEGDVVTFDALTKAFAIAAAAAQKAMVEREGQRVVTDSTIVYTDRTRSVNVSGHFEIVPGGGQAPIAGAGTANYNLAERSGRLTNATVVTEEQGQRWFINSLIAKTVVGDSVRRIPSRLYGLGGSLTSCDDSIPDYHFELKEIKRTEKTLVARPAVLYIRDIPVMWLPFVFQDIRPGRRSGILPPRFGASDIVRNNPGYRRHIENIGYYWALNDYMDATTWVDWRSATGGDSIDPGWYRLNAEYKYYWMSRFVQGRLASAYTRQRDGNTNTAISWGHDQRLGSERRIQMDANYVTSTRLQRQNTFNPYQAIATIRSSFNYSDKIGPASLSLGGRRTQFPGRKQVDQELPTFSLTTGSLALAPWLIWTPSFRFSESDNLHIDQPGTFTTRAIADATGRVIRTDTLNRNRFDRSISFDTPLKIFGFELRNAFNIRDQLNDYPEEKIVYPGADSSRKELRVFAKTFRTDVDWNPIFTLPPFFQNRFKLTPSVSLQNVDPRAFWVRSDLSGGRFVHQGKRLSYAVSAAPTIFGIWPGFGPFTRFRHSISPTLAYSIAPAAKVSDEYLEAFGDQKQHYLGSLPQSAVTLGLSQNVEAKVRPSSVDSTQSDAGQKLKLLSMQFSSLTYDFERAKAAHRQLAGLTTENFGTRVSSDLVPGLDLSVDYSLFLGSTQSDTAEFKPFLTRVASTFRISQRDNPFAVITRLFGKAVPDVSPAPLVGPGQSPQEAEMTRRQAAQPVAGQASRGSQFVVPPTKGWEATFSFSTSRTRPAKGGRVIEFDPRQRCDIYKTISPFTYDECLRAPIPSTDQPIPSTTAGAPYVQVPAQTSLSSALNFELTPKWSAAWQTSYDFEQHQFASQVVSLQRDLHDWRANFGFTHSPNGNFAFTFFIALKPQPELKFDYSRASYRGR